MREISISNETEKFLTQFHTGFSTVVTQEIIEFGNVVKKKRQKSQLKGSLY